jgi:hypothetical protein
LCLAAAAPWRPDAALRVRAADEEVAMAGPWRIIGNDLYARSGKTPSV